MIYTIILGDYDDLKEPQFIDHKFDYLCFTNRDDLVSPTWQIRKVKCNKRDTLKRCAAKITVFPFKILKEYSLSIFVNGQISIHCDIEKFLEKYLPEGKSLAIMRHPKRDCIYEEAKVVLEYKKDKPEIVGKQMLRYKKNGFPEHAGLISGGIIVRSHTDKKVIKHCKLWLREIKKYSQRDQLSFDYVLWRYKLIEPSFFPPEVRVSDFVVHPHNYNQTF